MGTSRYLSLDRYGDIPIQYWRSYRNLGRRHRVCITENRYVQRSFRSDSPCIVAAMRAATRRLTQLYDEAMVPTGLRITQFHILSELERRSADPPTVGELADILTMERSALGQTLRPLERDGLIDLGHDKRDARRRPIKLTKAGKDKVMRGRRYWAAAHEKFEHVFGDRQLVLLRETLRDIAESPQLPEAFQQAAMTSRGG
jgi:DNA-binding MarR family transcriptional regulator